MKKNSIVAVAIVLVLSAAGYAWLGNAKASRTVPIPETTSSSVRFVSSAITAVGTVTAQSQAKLAFQTSGKLVYLPFKEGDSVTVGQTIAQLDTYQLQRQLSAALNTYRSTRDTFDQVKDNAGDNVARTQQITAPNYVQWNSVSGTDRESAINDYIKRLVDQNQANLDNSVINVELANYALSMSRLTSPINGIVTHQDVNVSGVNITPATSFTVADPDSVVFRANIPAEQIYYISEGSPVQLAIDGVKARIPGVVTRMYPSKIIQANGQAVYQADISGDELKKATKLDMSGSAIITTNAKDVALIPAWTVLGGKYVWVDNGGTPQLREVTAGKIHGNEIEITKGLKREDRIIVDPRSIPAKLYQML